MEVEFFFSWQWLFNFPNFMKAWPNRTTETFKIKNLLTYQKYWLIAKVFTIGNKVKSRISKRVFQENKARQISRKTIISYPLIRTRKCEYQGLRNVHFLENLVCFKSSSVAGCTENGLPTPSLRIDTPISDVSTY